MIHPKRVKGCLLKIFVLLLESLKVCPQNVIKNKLLQTEVAMRKKWLLGLVAVGFSILPGESSAQSYVKLNGLYALAGIINPALGQNEGWGE